MLRIVIGVNSARFLAYVQHCRLPTVRIQVLFISHFPQTLFLSPQFDQIFNFCIV